MDLQKIQPSEDGVTHINPPFVQYKLTHIATGCFYIGSSNNFNRRKQQHIWCLKNGSHKNKRLQSLYLTSPDLEFEIIKCSDRQSAYDLEAQEIALNIGNPLMLNFCIDVKSPMAGLKFSDEHRDKISKALKGRELTPEWLEKLSVAKKGIPMTEERKAILVASLKGLPKSEEHRLAAAAGARLATGKPVEVNGVIYATITEAESLLGMEKRSILRRIHSDKPEFSTWKFLEKEIPVNALTGIDPRDDGKTHINLYSKASTRLGQALSHFDSRHPIQHPQWGHWRTLEGLWYFLGTGCTHHELAQMSGALAKKHGKTLTRVERPSFRADIRQAQLLKLLQHPQLLKEFTESTLPFTHYYYWGEIDKNPKLVNADPDGWLVQGFEWLRSHLQGT